MNTLSKILVSVVIIASSVLSIAQPAAASGLTPPWPKVFTGGKVIATFKEANGETIVVSKLPNNEYAFRSLSKPYQVSVIYIPPSKPKTVRSMKGWWNAAKEAAAKVAEKVLEAVLEGGNGNSGCITTVLVIQTKEGPIRFTQTNCPPK